MKLTSQLITILIALLCILSIVCIGGVFGYSNQTHHHTKTQHTSNFASLKTPFNLQPLSSVDIRVNFIPQDENDVYNQVNNDGKLQEQMYVQSFTSIHELSTETLKTLSTEKPLESNDPTFTPFGNNVRLQFSVPHIAPQSSHDNDDDGGEYYDASNNNNNNSNTSEEFVFVLNVDKNTISTSPNKASKFSILDSNDEFNAQDLYHTRVTYTGERIRSNGQVDTIVLSILPNSGDYAHLYKQDNDRLETLSTNGSEEKPMRPESLSSLSGRHDNGYTIEGLIFAADGRLIQITSFSTLLFQQTVLQDSLQARLDHLDDQIDNIDEQIEKAQEEQNNQGSLSVQGLYKEKNSIETQQLEVQSKLHELSDFISTLYEQQRDAAYDLSFSEVELGTHATSCGVDDHNNTKVDQTELINEVLTPNDEGGSPFNMVSQWALQRWVSTCHSRMGKGLSVLQIQYYLATNFQRWASNVRWTTEYVNAALISARLQWANTVMTYVTAQQFEIGWGIESSIALSTTATTYNPQSSICDVTTIFAQFGAWLNQDSATRMTDSAGTHLLLHCTGLSGSESSGGVAGKANLNAMCRASTIRYGVSSFTFNDMNSWTTLLHELGHNLNSKHAWEGASSGTEGQVGGIMDYGDSRLLSGVDQYKYGFHYASTGAAICTYINSFMTSSSDFISPESCFHATTHNALKPQNMAVQNGVLDQFEQCDAYGWSRTDGAAASSTVCCNTKGRFTNQSATCGFVNECCDTNCQMKNVKTRCKVNPNDSDSTGYCSAGQCLPLTWQPDANLAGCTEAQIWTNAQNSCVYEVRSTCSGLSWTLWTLSAELGSACLTPSNVQGFCAFNSASLTPTCVTGEYSWQVYTARECTSSLTQIDSYICLNAAGSPVGDSYCSSVTKPIPTSTIAGCTTNALYVVTGPTGNRSRGQSITVTWVYSGSNYYDKVDILLGTTSIATNIDNYSGSYTFTIPTTTPYTTSTYIRVKRTGSSSPYGDSASFAIPDPGSSPTISAVLVTSVGSTTAVSGVDSGSQFVVRWTLGGSATNVKVELYDGSPISNSHCSYIDLQYDLTHQKVVAVENQKTSHYHVVLLVVDSV